MRLNVTGDFGWFVEKKKQVKIVHWLIVRGKRCKPFGHFVTSQLSSREKYNINMHTQNANINSMNNF